MKRYLIALAMLICVWAWCDDSMLITSDAQFPRTVNGITGEIIIDGNMVIGQQVGCVFIMFRADGKISVENYCGDAPTTIMLKTCDRIEANIKVEMIMALTVAKEKLEAEGDVILGYQMNGASASIIHRATIKKDILDDSLIWDLRQETIVYPPELVKMIEELEGGGF